MKKILLTTVLGLGMSGIVSAAMIVGSLPFSDFNATENNTTIGTSTVFSDAHTETSGVGQSDFSIVPIGTDFGAFTLNLSTIASGGGVSISNAVYGTFTATSGTVVNQTANFLDVSVTGTYTPGPAFPSTTTSNAASFRIQFNQSGASLGGGDTLAAPPAGSTPEPATYGLVGAALIGLGMKRRKQA